VNSIIPPSFSNNPTTVPQTLLLLPKMMKQEILAVASSSADPCPPSTGSDAITASIENDHTGQHRDLKNISVVNCDTFTEIIPNTSPVKLDNECFSGEVMLMVRTPDVDSKKEPMPTSEVAARISEYFKGVKRRFEFQFQIKLKRVPTGPLFLGCEIEEIIKLSRFTKGLTTMLLAMIRRINSGFHYGWGLDMETADPVVLKDGNYEKTHLSFPVEASMDRIIITKPGEEPPKLGHEHFESNASVKRRKKMGSGSVDWNTEDTYTLCLWSAYFDWIQWKVMNIPGGAIRPFSLGIVTARQPIYLSVYELPGITPQEYKKKRPPHNRSDLKVFTKLEFANADHTDGGIAPRFQEKGARMKRAESTGETDSEMGSESDGNESEGKQVGP